MWKILSLISQTRSDSKRGRELRAGLALAIALHLGLAVFGLVHFQSFSDPKPLDVISVPVTLVAPQGTRKSANTRLSGSGTQQMRPFPGHVTLKDWLGTAPRPKVGGTSNDGPGVASTLDSPAAQRFRTMSWKEDSELYPLLRGIHERVERTTLYPEVLIKNREAGSVDVEFWVEPNGRLAESKIQISSANPTLKAFVLATLIHALKDPLPDSFRARNQTRLIPISLHYDFVLRIRGTEPLRPVLRTETQRLRNSAFVYRDAAVDPILNDKWNQLWERMPIVFLPVPGGVMIDFIQTFRNLSDLGKPTASDRTRQELEFRREEWKRLTTPFSGT